MFRKEQQLLVSLQHDIENTDSIEANTVAYLSTKIQEIRSSLQARNVSVEKASKKSESSSTSKSLFKKPVASSLADQKKKEYYF